MSKKSIKRHEEMAHRLLEVLIARLDKPVERMIPEVTLEPIEIDDDWSLFKEAHPEVFDEKSGSVSIERMMTAVSGTSRITIRVHNRVLQAFRQEADKTGVAYQSLMNRALANAVDAIK